MKKTSFFFCAGGLGAALLFAACSATATVVYDNASNDLGVNFNPGTNEIGDEVVLAGTDRYVTNFIFQYYATNLVGNEEIRVRFYKNDGPPSSSGPLTPGTVFYDSGFFNIGAFGSTPRATLVFDRTTLQQYNGNDILAPDSFTWSVQFKNMGAGGSFGETLYNPPTVGQNYNDYWDNTGIEWQLKTNLSTAISFAARIEATAFPGLSIFNFQHSGNTTTFSFLTQAGQTHTVQYKDNLDDASWQTLETVYGNGDTVNITDPTATGPTRFYRVSTSSEPLPS
ncbi:MAG: hypothetical protein NTZ16_14065 [Verrucomicrobia bacterium]|nr:hypothetical protein [Verrucomicrobiota bacterium]